MRPAFRRNVADWGDATGVEGARRRRADRVAGPEVRICSVPSQNSAFSGPPIGTWSVSRQPAPIGNGTGGPEARSPWLEPSLVAAPRLAMRDGVRVNTHFILKCGVSAQTDTPSPIRNLSKDGGRGPRSANKGLARQSGPDPAHRSSNKGGPRHPQSGNADTRHRGPAPLSQRRACTSRHRLVGASQFRPASAGPHELAPLSQRRAA